MLYKNNKEQVRVRTGYEKGFGWHWKYVDKGETIDLPKEIGDGYGFDKVEKPVKEGRHGGKKIETKKFKDKLTDIKGLGSKTADDLLSVYPDEGSLKKAIKDGKQIPLRDDLAKKVEKKFKWATV